MTQALGARLGCGKIFAKLDLASGYWQIPLHPKDREKTGVVTHFGLFEFLSLPFRFKTARATFQRAMQTVFANYLMGNVTGHSDAQIGFCMPYGMSMTYALEEYLTQKL